MVKIRGKNRHHRVTT